MANSHPSGKKKTTVAGVVIALLIGGYTVLRPAINDATGWNLPSIAEQDNAGASRDNVAAKPSPQSDTPASSARTAPTDASARNTTSSSAPDTSTAERPKSDPSSRDTAESKTTTTKRGPLADRMSSSKSTATAKTDTNNSSATDSESDSSLKYGLLREVGRERYISPAGLMYTPGSAEGHRLEHLRRHTADQPGRPGKHGVFDGGMEGALKTIDKAYENAKIGKRTTQKTDKGRTIYTVDMGKRVGFVGGREGNQRRKPMARRVQLVLEGNRVITAYPL